MLMLFCVVLTHPGMMRRSKSHRCRRFINVSIGCKDVKKKKKAKEGKKNPPWLWSLSESCFGAFNGTRDKNPQEAERAENTVTLFREARLPSSFGHGSSSSRVDCEPQAPPRY